MKNTLLPISIAFMTVTVASAANGDETSYLHRANLQSFCVAGNCYNIDHTWAETNSGGCSNDAASSMNGSSGGGTGSNICASTNGSSACAWVRGPYNAQWSYNNGDYCSNFWSHYGNCYNNSSPGTYAWNGVCHQETNRSFFHTAVPWVENMPIGGAGLTHGIWGYCGAANPWGSTYGCGC